MRTLSRLYPVLLAVALGAAALPAQAQLRFALGPRLGISFGTISVDPDLGFRGVNGQTLQSTKSGRVGMIFGSDFELQFGRMFGAEVEVLYVMNGTSYDIPQAGVTRRYKVNELSIPILFKARFLPGQIQPYAFVGPSLGFTTSATMVDEAAGAQGQQAGGNEVDLSSVIGGFDFGLVFGGGAEFLFARNFGAFMDLRYMLGLTNLYSAPAGALQQLNPNLTTPSYKFLGLQIQLGTKFHF